MGRRVERTHAGKTWTKARYFGFIRSALRRAYSRYPVKFQVLQDSRRKKKGGKRFEYHCNGCKKWFPNSQVEVDHIEGAGRLSDYSDLPGFCERLFCESDNLQVLCKGCHAEKTQAEREARKK